MAGLGLTLAVSEVDKSSGGSEAATACTAATICKTETSDAKNEKRYRQLRVPTRSLKLADIRSAMLPDGPMRMGVIAKYGTCAACGSMSWYSKATISALAHMQLNRHAGPNTICLEYSKQIAPRSGKHKAMLCQVWHQERTAPAQVDLRQPHQIADPWPGGRAHAPDESSLPLPCPPWRSAAALA